MGWITRNVPDRLLAPLRQARQVLAGKPRIGGIDFGDLRRLQPICRDFGTTRGLPVDRHYVEAFLDAHRADVRGRVLEVGEDTYTRRFGDDRVEDAQVLHVHGGNPRATIVADLQDAPHIPDRSFDCVILTQTLQLVYRPHDAVRTLARILRPGGVLLLTVPGITQVATGSEWGSTWYWALTRESVGRLLGEAFGESHVAVATHGNVLAATAQLYGIAAAELTPDELAAADADYQVVITARAVSA
jgi:SAM-dependent methyltransferase